MGVCVCVFVAQIAQFCHVTSSHDKVDCAIARCNFVAETNQTNMTDYDILASSSVLVGCLAKRKRAISRRVQKMLGRYGTIPPFRGFVCEGGL